MTVGPNVATRGKSQTSPTPPMGGAPYTPAPDSKPLQGLASPSYTISSTPVFIPDTSRDSKPVPPPVSSAPALKAEEIPSEKKESGGGVGGFLYTLFCEDFVNAGKGIIGAVKGYALFQAKTLMAIGQCLIGDFAGASKTFSSGLNDLKDGAMALVQNAISIAFAAMTIAAIVGTGGAAVAGVVFLRGLLKQGIKVAIKELGKIFLEKVGVVALKSMLRQGGVAAVKKAAVKYACEKTGVTMMKTVFKDGFRQGMMTVGEYGLKKTGITAVKGVFNEGFRTGAVRTTHIIMDACRTKTLAAVSSVKMHNLLSISNDVIQETRKLSEILGKTFTKDLVDVAKVAEREPRMAKESQAIFNSVIKKRKSGEVLDIPKSLSTMVKENKRVNGATKLISNEVAEEADKKAFKILQLMNEGSYDKKYIQRELRALGIADEDMAEATRIVTSRDMKVAVRSGVFKKEMQKEMIGTMQTQVEKELREKFAELRVKVAKGEAIDGEIGTVYKKHMDEYFDKLVKDGKITEDEARALKEAHEAQVEEMYVQGAKDGIEVGVTRAFKRFHEKHFRFELPEAAEERKRRKIEKAAELSLFDGAAHIDWMGHRYHKAEQEEAKVGPDRNAKKHWLSDYFDKKREEDVRLVRLEAERIAALKQKSTDEGSGKKAA